LAKAIVSKGCCYCTDPEFMYFVLDNRSKQKQFTCWKYSKSRFSSGSFFKL